MRGSDPELGEYLLQLSLHRARAEEQPGADLWVGPAVACETGDLLLLGRNLVARLDRTRAHLPTVDLMMDARPRARASTRAGWRESSQQPRNRESEEEDAPGARSRMLVVAPCDRDRTIGDDARKSVQRARRRLTLGRSHPGKSGRLASRSQPGIAAPAGPAFYPVATICQIDPNVLISSPVACVVFLDARSGVK
jgi:hypothetical protein